MPASWNERIHVRGKTRTSIASDQSHPIDARQSHRFGRTCAWGFSGTATIGAVSVVGSYVIRPCEGERYGTCKNILRPENPAKPIYIELRTHDFVGFFQPGGFSILDVDLQSADFGAGRGRGLVQRKDDGTIDLIITLIF